jgi:capsular exopolysaccharide synthesis family protein
VTASSNNASQAASDANAFAKTYADVRRQSTVDELLTASSQLQSRITDLDSQLATINQPLNELDAQIANASAQTRPALQAQRADLVSHINSQVSSLQSRRAAYADQLDQLQLETNLTVTGGAQVVSQASVPSSPVSPKPVRNGGIALGVGLVLGLALAFLFDHLDDRIHGKEDVERASGLTVVGLIPAVPGWRNRADVELVTVDAPNSASAEAYRSLRTSLQFLGLERDTRVVQVTSSTSGEGKTTTVANLAVSLTGAGKRVIVMDCDLRRPRIHSFFGLEHTLGLTSVIVGDVSLASAIQPAVATPRLAVLPSGPVPPNPSELLALRRFSELVDACKQEADYVLIDSPPVLPVADARVISAVADVTFVVVTAERTNMGDVEAAVEMLRQVDAPVLGTILNAIPNNRRLGYRYGYDYYGYGYGSYRSTYAPGSATNGSAPARRGLFRRKKSKNETERRPDRATDVSDWESLTRH